MHTSFEALVADLAARLATVEPDHIDDAIVEGLRLISQRLDFDRSSWSCVPAGADDAIVTHSWARVDDPGTHSGECAHTSVEGLLSRLKNGEVVTFSSPDQLSDPAARDGVRRFGIKSSAGLPFFANGELKAVLGLSTLRHHREWAPEVIIRLRLIVAVFGQALLRKESEERLRGALAELRRVRDDLASDNVHLRRGGTILSGQAIVAESPATRRVLEQIGSVAPTDATVLLLGETGSGKEVFAQAIHRASPRHKRPMVTVNCAALPPTLIESELFGRERGAYTGALARQIGRFEMAHGSTIFLDEIGELSLDAQVKLLRVIQEKVIERLGGGQPVKVDVRIIAATNRNLEQAVEEHTFREDLFYRLNVFPIVIPPLRERIEDIPALAWTFIDECASAFHRRIDSISKESLAALKHYTWPGNVRELRNVIERAIIVTKSSRLVVDLPTGASAAFVRSMRLDDVQTQQIKRVLDSVGWRVRGAGGAAEILGINPNTLDSRMAKLGIRRPVRDAKSAS